MRRRFRLDLPRLRAGCRVVPWRLGAADGHVHCGRRCGSSRHHVPAHVLWLGIHRRRTPCRSRHCVWADRPERMDRGEGNRTLRLGTVRADWPPAGGTRRILRGCLHRHGHRHLRRNGRRRRRKAGPGLVQPLCIRRHVRARVRRHSLPVHLLGMGCPDSGE